MGRIRSHRYKFLSEFCFDAVWLNLYSYPWLPCHPKQIRVALISLRKKKAASNGGRVNDTFYKVVSQ